jgi:hypothetical protein
MYKNPELSQISTWTGESMINIKSATTKDEPVLKQRNLPDKEQLLEDILVLR